MTTYTIKWVILPASLSSAGGIPFPDTLQQQVSFVLEHLVFVVSKTTETGRGRYGEGAHDAVREDSQGESLVMKTSSK